MRAVSGAGVRLRRPGHVVRAMMFGAGGGIGSGGRVRRVSADPRTALRLPVLGAMRLNGRWGQSWPRLARRPLAVGAEVAGRLLIWGVLNRGLLDGRLRLL